MKTMRTIALLCWIFTVGAQGQDALSKAQADLNGAKKQYEELSLINAAEEGKLIREVESLDDQVLELSKAYSQLQREQELISSKKDKLDTEIEKRKIEFKYYDTNFKRYITETKNKVHPAEVQTLMPLFAEYEAQIDAAGSSDLKKIQASLPLLNAGIDRILNLAGGAVIEGKAQSDDAIVVDGKFAVLGPVGFFSSEDGSLSGETKVLTGDVKYPALQSSQGGAVASVVNSGAGTVQIDGSGGKAYNLEKASKGLEDYLEGGGMVGYVIVGLGLFSLFIGFIKFLEINFFHVPSRKTINNFLDAKLSGDDENAELIASKVRGLSGKMVKTGSKYFHSKRRILEDALFEKFTAIPPRLERGLPFLSLVAASAPMLGLLGTVLGIMKTFALMSEGGSSNIKFISGGISEALITTFMGLTVAIPILLIHGFLKGMAKGKSGDAEGVAMAIINGTSEITDPKADKEKEEKDAEEEEEIEDLVPSE